MSQVATCYRRGVTCDSSWVTCDSSWVTCDCSWVTCDSFSVTCGHLWHRSLNMFRFYTVIYWRGARRFFFQHFWGGPSSIILAYFTFRKALLRWSQERHGSMNIQTFIWHCNYKVINKWMIYRAFFHGDFNIIDVATLHLKEVNECGLFQWKLHLTTTT